MTGGDNEKRDRPRIAAMERGPGPARYTMPNLTGQKAHDPTKKLNPCYSFGTKLPTSFFRKDFGPGPSHLLEPSITKRGKDGTPHYSLYGRHKELTPFNTPGPSAYAPEQYNNPYSVKPPAYSMGVRTQYRKRDANPSPNSYTLPSLIGDRIPNRTASACYSMPGRRNVGGFDVDYAKTPGPARYGITTADVNQRKAPCYSIQGRNYMPSNSTRIPGPGAHRPERNYCQVLKRASPSYSLGVKHSDYVCPIIIDASD